MLSLPAQVNWRAGVCLLSARVFSLLRYNCAERRPHSSYGGIAGRSLKSLSIKGNPLLAIAVPRSI